MLKPRHRRAALIVGGLAALGLAAAQEFEVAVPAGAQRLDVTIGNPSDLSADLDLTVYNAAGELVGQDADGDSEESVSLPSAWV